VEKAISIFVKKYGGGDIKLFGGEPLLEPALVRRAIELGQSSSAIRRVYLSTNGLGLDEAWLCRIAENQKTILTLSMDGKPADHRGLRRALPGVPDTYDHILSLLPLLLQTPRVVITQTIAPSTARRAAENFGHLLGLGFSRFNFLPGYYLPWRIHQLENLKIGFEQIAEQIRQHWRSGKRLYVRNLFVRAPTPFFNSGFIVDSDRTIHPSNLGLSGKLDHLREQTCVGDLDNPPTPLDLRAAAADIPALLSSALPEEVWDSTQKVDAALTRFCHSLMPDWHRYRTHRRRTAV